MKTATAKSVSGVVSRPSTQAFPDNGARARAIRNIQEWITNGALPTGQPLPAERELAARLQVNRGTLRSALEHLSDEGFIRSNGGRIRIVTVPRAEPSGLLQDVIAVFADNEGQVVSSHRQSGWMDYLSRGQLDAIRDAGLHALIIDPARFAGDAGRQFLGRDRPRGAVLTCASGRPEYSVEIALRLKEVGVHVVLHGDAPPYHSFDRVTSDHEEGSYQLTRWFLAQGRKRILNFWPAPASDYWFAARRVGYERAMLEAGLEPLPTAVIEHPSDEEYNAEGFQRTARGLAGYLAEHLSGPGNIDTLLLASDGFVPATAAACRLFGKEPNEDVWIGGYDNYWADLSARQFEPVAPMATVDKNNRELGAEMVRLLLERCEGDLPQHPARRTVSPKLIEMKSMA